MLQRVAISILIIIFSVRGLIAEDRKLQYTQNLTISDGLAHNGVTSIIEDSKGYIWISTYDGLNRYDGYEFEVFKNTVEDDLFVSNRIRTIEEDKNGNIWIGTDEGISIYNYSLERFNDIYSNKLNNNAKTGPIVRKILVDNEISLTLCATEGSGILAFNDNYTFLKQYIPPKEFSENPILFFDGIELDKTNFIFTTSIGLLHFNIEREKFQRVVTDEIAYCNSVTRIGESSLLITLLSGVAIIEYDTNESGFSYVIKSKKLDLYQFNDASSDELGNIWLTSLNQGLLHIDDTEALKNGIFFEQASYNVERGVLRMSCVVASTNSGCWVGTFDNGIYRFDLEENPFKSYNVEMDYKFGIRSNEILHIARIDDHRVYVSANRGGIALFNTREDKFSPILCNPSPENLLYWGAIYVDSKKNTWLKNSLDRAFYRVKAGSRNPEKVTFKDHSSFSPSEPRSFAEDRQGNIWIGGVDGVCKICLDKFGEIKNIESLNDNPYFSSKKITLVRYLYVDPLYKYLWIGSGADGLFRVDIKDDVALDEAEINQYVNDKNNKLSVSSNFVSSIVRLPNGELWIGTERGGICKVINSEKDPVFITFSEKHGLSNNVVKSILYDDEYNLWVSTNIGLNKFDTKDFTFRTFRKEDGLPFEDFSYASVFLDNGLIMLSGFDGFCYFDPENLPDRELLPRLEFSNLRIFNKTILPGDIINKRVVIERRLNELEEIVLKHKEDVFSIEVKSLHFSSPESHYLRYQLLPINEEWIEVPSSQRNIYYNGLQPGEYELRVIASNSLNEWTEPKTLKIIITPPFWTTTPAFVLYFLFVILIIYMVMHYILRLNALKHNLEIEQFEKDKVQEVNAAKLRFFSNISHEIKTPLTLISGPINLLAERFKRNEDVMEKLQLVQRQSKKMLQLVDQVHDFQRADANRLKMNYSNFYFDIFIRELISDFEFMAKNDKKNLVLNGSETRVFVSADKNKLEKIFNNLLNNAFKYTKPDDTIEVKYVVKNNELIVSVDDTGKGIDSDDLPYIFERFYQSKKKNIVYSGGSGIGLAFSKLLVEMHFGYINAESEIDKGTKIVVRLPIITPEQSVDLFEREQELLLAEKHNELSWQEQEGFDPANIQVDEALAGARIFFAEDNIDMRKYVSGILSSFFEIETFLNGQECLNALENEWPDIIISDVLMPELNGFDLCKKVKSDIKTSHIPVILLTANTTVDKQIQGIKLGADAYIKKPFDVEHLVANVETLLRNRKLLRERFQIDLPLTLGKGMDNNKDSVFLEKLYNLMADNLDNQNLDLDNFAKELFLNRTHFYKKVKALTNQTPFEFLKAYRLRRAAYLLVQKQHSVNEVYMMTGFKSRTHFSKLFKERYDITPGKYASESINKISLKND